MKTKNKFKKPFIVLLYFFALFFIPLYSYALISIDITRGNIDPLPIALPYLSAEGDQKNQKTTKDLRKNIVNVVENDLESTGLFRSINREAFIQNIEGSRTIPNYPDWRQINASALLVGGVNLKDTTSFDTEFRLWDTLDEKQIAGKAYSTNTQNWRRIAHLISDEIYERLTGEEGYFDTRIVYVSESGSATKRIKRLAIMDQDGANHRYLTDGSDLVLTPRFSPTAQKVIYMSYASGIPKVYMIDVDSKKKTLIGNFPGMSFAPRFSPDGKSIIMSVSLDGNSEIYKMDLKTKRKTRLTNNRAIDTSPSFSPNGKKIVFNSDRGGSQQLYIMDNNGKM